MVHCFELKPKLVASRVSPHIAEPKIYWASAFVMNNEQFDNQIETWKTIKWDQSTGCVKAMATTDQLIEAFSAQLVERGHNVIQLEENDVRTALFSIYEKLGDEILSNAGDKSWKRTLVKFRNLFEPSQVGSFDDFETMMRSKQTYMTNHPNPYYQYISIQIPSPVASSILDRLDQKTKGLVDKLATVFLKHVVQSK